MPTQLKIDEVARLKERMERATSLVLADYRGLTANEMVELREKFTKEGLEYCVVKDTLARIAAREAGIEGLAEMFDGPISMAVSYEDPAVTFKLSEACRKTYAPRYEVRGGLFEGALVSEGEVKRYALLPTREELLAKLAMLLSSPMRALAVMLKAKIRELAVVLSEVAKKRAEDPDVPPAGRDQADAEDAGDVESATDAEPTAASEAEEQTAADRADDDSIEKEPEAEPEAAAEPEEQDSEEEQKEEA
jgi:large subunit ribosomal protein L10